MEFRSSFSVSIIFLLLIISFVSFSKPEDASLKGVLPLDLSMTKDVNDVNGNPITVVTVGDTFKYKLFILNSGSNSASAATVQVDDFLPPEVAFQLPFVDPVGWTCNVTGLSLSCVNNIALDPGMTQVIDFPVVAQIAATSVINNATVIADPNFLFDTDTSNDTDMAIVNINNAPPALTAIKTVQGGIAITGASGATREFTVGDGISYQISVTNSSASRTYTDVEIGDPLPTEFSFVSASATVGFVCNYDAGFHDVICTNDANNPLGPGQIVDVMIQGTAMTAGFGLPNSAFISSPQFGDMVETNLTLIDIVNPVVPMTILEVSSESFVDGVAVSSIQKGSAFTYQVTVKNAGNEDAGDVVLRDVLPQEVRVDNVSGIGWSCNALTSQEYSCSLTAPLLAGSSAIVEFDVTDLSDPTLELLTNFAEVVASNADTQSTSNTVNFNQASFNVDISYIPGLLEPNSAFDIVVDVVNTGSLELSGIEVVNTIPDGFSYVALAKNTSTCSVSGQVMTCSIDSPVAVGVTDTITIPVMSIAVVDETVVYTNLTEINSPDLTTPLTISTVLDFVVPVQVFDVEIVKSLDVSEVLVNGTFEYLLTVTNVGENDATGITVTDNLPVGLQFNSAIAADWSCSGATQVVCLKDSLAVGASSNIVLSVTAPAQVGIINNMAQVAINEVDSNAANDVSQVTVAVVTELTIDADLSVSVNSNDDINQGDALNFEILAKNNGPDVATKPLLNVAVTGLIESITVAEGSDWTCQVQSLAISCLFNDSVMNIGQLSPLNIMVATTEVLMDSQDVNVSVSISSVTNDSNLSNNVASSVVVVDEIPDGEELGDVIDAVIGSSANEQISAAVENISSFCEDSFFTALDGLCGDLYQAALSGDRDAVTTFIKQVTPSEVIGQSTSVVEIANTQFRNVGSRLSQLRSGGGSGFSSAGLNARYGNGSIPLGMLAYLNKTEDEINNIDTNNDFISPWGFFVNGSISMGKKDATGRELGFDFDTFGLTAGFDYRINAKKVVGIALGYANFESTIGNSAEMKSTGVTLSGYGSFYITDNLYVDTRVSYGNPEFKQSRSIDFTLGNRRIQKTAVSNTDADQYSVSMSTGYSFYKNAWNITPNASFSYVNTTINGFTETGAGAFSFIFDEQKLDSLVWSTGIMISKAISMKKGVLTPQFDFNYNYESKNNAQDVVARFVNAPSDQLFIIKTDSPDRSFASAGIGFVYISANGKQAYINYRSILSLKDFSRDTINVGMRFEF